ncbi:sporulation protein Cse60 [Paenibacillus aceti]|uniref:DUF2758 domain-containing protein n=1 Tax=Paenibacillus aceti TaxID=1820010 RepID=A0ABQ1VQX1_9BACL|nr:sporulation protein Cse60 [Paenibacillus aceti]GGF86639.1 hypothetical protein GCM10010913_05190 [Paenibacillus aceti]
MLGKASEIKTIAVYENQYSRVDEAVNRAVNQMNEFEIIDIKYASTLVGQRFWGSALIIYKEANTHE